MAHVFSQDPGRRGVQAKMSGQLIGKLLALGGEARAVKLDHDTELARQPGAALVFGR